MDECVLQYLLVVAGIIDETRAGLKEIDADRMLRLFQTNTIGPLLVAQQLLAAGLLKQGSVIANMTSKVTPSSFSTYPMFVSTLLHLKY